MTVLGERVASGGRGEHFGLAAEARRRARDLSVGNRQRVALARALFHDYLALLLRASRSA